MYKVLEPIVNLVKVKHFTISDIYFKFSTEFTPILLIFFSGLLSTMDVLRTSIDCYTDMTGNGRKAIMDNYCWSVGTYTCKNQTNNLLACFNPTEENKIYQRYYQWICLVFVVQSILLYLPSHLWKISEGGLMHKICDDLDTIFKREKWNDGKRLIMDYFNSHYVDHLHTKYVRHFIVFNVLNTVFVVLNIVMFSVIIPGFWSRYYKAISALLTGDPTNWMFHSEIIFPKAAKCTYESYGPSGSIQNFDALCLLPLNILNQKLFMIVWIWYIFQLIISILILLHWIVVSYSEKVRTYILYQKSMKSISRKRILYALGKAHLGHFFVLNQISKNTNPETFVEIITALSMKIESTEQENVSIDLFR